MGSQASIRLPSDGEEPRKGPPGRSSVQDHFTYQSVGPQGLTPGDSLDPVPSGHSTIANADVQFMAANVHSCLPSKPSFRLASHFPKTRFVVEMTLQYDAWQHESTIRIESCKIEGRRIHAREIG